MMVLKAAVFNSKSQALEREKLNFKTLRLENQKLSSEG